MSKRKISGKRGIVVGALAAVLLCGGSAALIAGRSRETKEADTVWKEAEVQFGTLAQEIVESGNVEVEEDSVSYDLELTLEESEEETDEEEEAENYLQIEEVAVASGQRIEEGDELFRFTEESMKAVRRQLESQIAEAGIALAEAENTYREQKQEAETVYQTSLAEADTAYRTYSTALARLEQEISQKNGQILVLQAEIEDYRLGLTEETFLEEYEQARLDYEKAQTRLEEGGTASVAAQTSNYRDWEEAKERFDALEEERTAMEEGITDNEAEIVALQEEIAEAGESLSQNSLSAGQSYDSAVLSGELADKIYEYTIEELEETREAAQAQVEEAEALLEAYEAFVGEEGVLYADGSGVVTEVFYEAGDRLTAEGSMLSYVKDDSYSVTIDVSEEDIAWIQVGDEMEIELDAYPDADYSGIVTAVGTSAADGYAATVSYPVTLDIQGDTAPLFGGMSADIRFETETAEAVLSIPVKAVQKETDGSTWVYVKNGNGEREQRTVTTGFSDGTSVAVTEGLAEGDVVYVPDA